jgi:hypothetical protein
LELVRREAGVDPRRRLRIILAAPACGHLHQIQCTGKISFQPTNMSTASVGMQIGFDIDHLLIGFRGFVEAAAFH